jgi:hypothetical protein
LNDLLSLIFERRRAEMSWEGRIDELPKLMREKMNGEDKGID